MNELPDLTPPAGDKRALRRWARRRRRSLELQALSEAICGGLVAWLAERPAAQVVTYRAFRSEIDLSPLERARPEGWLLPRIDGQRLALHPLPCPLVRHRFGQLEPDADAPERAPEAGWVVLVPGLLMTRDGGRLGYGGGFYDRLLASLPTGVEAVGIVPEALVVDRLPLEPWDQRVGWLATERGLSRTGAAEVRADR